MPSEFYDLGVWQIAHKLTIELYKLTAHFPKEERFELVSQIRRALVSIELNIAEGHGRYHHKDAVNFFVMARGSAFEVRAALLIARDLGYLSDSNYKWLDKECLVLVKKLNSLISYRRGKDAKK